MKKIIICLILGFTAGIVFGQANVPAIVVSTFSTRGQVVTADDAESITELFIAELAKQSGVRVVDRTSIERVVAEMKFQISDWSNPQKTAQLGAALNAEFLVRGQLNQLGTQISFALTALDIKTLEVVSSSTATFTVDNIFSTASGGLFGRYYSYSSQTYINYLSGEIAGPIKTKMTQLAEQRKKEQEEREKQQKEEARLQEQSQYSLVGTWTIGEFYRSDTLTNLIYQTDGTKKASINQSRTKGNSSTRILLSFSSDGTMEYYYESCDYPHFTQVHRRGTYRQRGDQVEYSISGTETTLTGSNWSNWNENYREYKETSRNTSDSGTSRIEFRGGGDALLFGGREYKRQSYSPAR